MSATWTEITTHADLVELLGEPAPRVRDKARPALVDLDWLAASPFCVMATAAGTGEADASPKGDPAGQLVHVIDDSTIALAERRATGEPTATRTSSTTPTSAWSS